ncbi:MAG: SUF system NifU family Fe-S cluster assembly protein [Myxococcales bacterium]|nr:MAG: SUF system NifU family Fe-S cluster assembly protein [Myxococcales bacterium]
MKFGDLDSLYREVILDHHRHPRGRDPLERVDLHSEGANPSCGDEVTLELMLDGDRIAQAFVRVHGCSICMASGSILSELVKGKDEAESVHMAEQFKALLRGKDAPADAGLGDLEALAGVRQFPLRVKCALLPWETLREAFATAGKQSKTP